MAGMVATHLGSADAARIAAKAAKTKAEQDARNAPSQQMVQQTANITPSVRPLMGPNPVTQPAYEQQAHTKLQADLAAKSAAANQQWQTGQTASGQQHDITTMNLAAQLEQQKIQQQQQAEAQAWREKLGSITGLIDTPTSGDGEAAKAARDAVFAREKDRVGQIGRASLDALNNVLGERGLIGSGYEAGATSDVIGDTQSELVDVVRSQTVDEANALAEEDARRFAATQSKNQALLGLLSSGGGLY